MFVESVSIQLFEPCGLAYTAYTKATNLSKVLVLSCQLKGLKWLTKAQARAETSTEFFFSHKEPSMHLAHDILSLMHKSIKIQYTNECLMYM